MREGRILEDIFIGTHTLQLLKIGEMPILIVDGTPHEEDIGALLIPVDRNFGITGSLEFLRELGKPFAKKAQLLVGKLDQESESSVLAAANVIADALIEVGIIDISIELVTEQDVYAGMMERVRRSVGGFDLVLLEYHDHISRGELTLGSLLEDVVTNGRMPVLCAPSPRKS